MTIEVYHREYDESTNISQYKLVAKFDVPKEELDRQGFEVDDISSASLEYAWRYTNNVLGSWSKNDTDHNPDYSPYVEVVGEYPIGRDGKEYGLRSSMVGDIFVYDNQEWVVAPVGFKKLDESKISSKIEMSEDQFAIEGLGFKL